MLRRAHRRGTRIWALGKMVTARRARGLRSAQRRKESLARHFGSPLRLDGSAGYRGEVTSLRQPHFGYDRSSRVGGGAHRYLYREVREGLQPVRLCRPARYERSRQRLLERVMNSIRNSLGMRETEI